MIWKDPFRGVYFAFFSSKNWYIKLIYLAFFINICRILLSLRSLNEFKNRYIWQCDQTSRTQLFEFNTKCQLLYRHFFGLGKTFLDGLVTLEMVPFISKNMLNKNWPMYTFFISSLKSRPCPGYKDVPCVVTPNTGISLTSWMWNFHPSSFL